LALEEGSAAARLAMSGENAMMVLGHMLDNAQRHGAARVEIAARDEDGRLVVLVSDDGAGVSAGNRGRIFEPFFTTRREADGTGMGLVIVRALLRAHGGDIRLAQSASEGTADSTAGSGAGGAVFALELPSLNGAPRRPFGLGDALARLRARLGRV
jgi:signal transduction histidine kinase